MRGVRIRAKSGPFERNSHGRTSANRGRDPVKLGGVATVIAKNGNWMPYLKISQLNNHWDQVVGPGVAQHSHVVSLRDGVLTIAAESQVWATQLTFLIPQLTDTITRKLEGLPITDIRVRGPSVGYSRKWGKRR